MCALSSRRNEAEHLADDFSGNQATLQLRNFAIIIRLQRLFHSSEETLHISIEVWVLMLCILAARF